MAHVTTQKVVEFVPGKKVIWFVTGSGFNFIKDKEEWKGTKIVFELSPVGNKTIKDRFYTCIGLTPQVECHDDCSWAHGNNIFIVCYN